MDDQSQRIPSTQLSVLLSLGGYLCWWTIDPRVYHPSSSQYYYHKVDTSADGRLVPEDTIHPVVSIIVTRWIPLLVDYQSQRIPSIQQSLLLSLGGYLCLWTISPRGYLPHSSQYYYHQVDTSVNGLLVPENTIQPVISITITRWIPLLVDDQSQRIPSTQQSVLLSLGGYLCWWTINPRVYHSSSSHYYYHQVDTSAGGRLVPEDTIHPIVSITITRWIPLLVDYQSQRIPSTQQSVLQSLGGYLCWWTISPSGYHPPNSQYCNHWVYTSAGGRLVPEDTIYPLVSITITRWIPLVVDYQSQRIPSTQQSVLLSLGGYLCWWNIIPREYHPPSSQYIITRWIPLLVDDLYQRIPSTQQSVLLSLGGYLCWWTIRPREYHPPSSQYINTRWIPLLMDD